MFYGRCLRWWCSSSREFETCRLRRTAQWSSRALTGSFKQWPRLAGRTRQRPALHRLGSPHVPRLHDHAGRHRSRAPTTRRGAVVGREVLGFLERGRETTNRCLTGWFFARLRSYAVASAGIATFSGHVAERRVEIRCPRCAALCDVRDGVPELHALLCGVSVCMRPFFSFCTEVCKLAVLSVFHANPAPCCLLPPRFVATAFFSCRMTLSPPSLSATGAPPSV